MTKMKEQDRPLVTFAIFSYNQEQFIREAIESAFSQTYEPMEIILSDDCSTDRTFEIMQEMATKYVGPHRVIARKSHSNLGIGPHVSTVISEAKGEYVAFAAGDDISKSDRIDHAIDVLSTITSSGNAWTRYSFLSTLSLIDQTGKLFGKTKAPSNCNSKHAPHLPGNCRKFGLDDLLRGRLYTSGPSRIISKDLHLVFGEIRSDCFTEDIVYLFRTVLAGKIVFSEQDTVFYRKHDTNISSPETLYAKPFEGVAAQLKADLATAINKGLISRQEAKRAQKWINNTISFRAFYLARVTGNRPLFADFLSLMRASHLSFRRKFGIFREYIGVR